MIRLVPRPQPSRLWAALSPVFAILAMLLAAALVLAAMGREVAPALYVYFAQPLHEAWLYLIRPDERAMWIYTPTEVLVKAIPLALIGAGLTICFRANVWNIGAAGQYTLGAIASGWVALHAAETALWPHLPGWGWLVVYLLAGVLGGMVWAAIPALLRTRFNANEILVSLMLAYVAGYLLDFLVRGPWQDPAGRGFPESPEYQTPFLMPVLVETTRLHLGLILALAAAALLTLMLSRTLRGFRVLVIGAAPRAGAFAGFSQAGTVWFVLLVSGGLAGLAGAVETASTIQQLQPDISAEYGFIAIIAAFLGRLNPLGACLGALVLGITYIGGENAQIFLKLPKNVAGLFQGMLLFFLLAADVLIRYRVVIGREVAA